MARKYNPRPSKPVNPKRAKGTVTASPTVTGYSTPSVVKRKVGSGTVKTTPSTPPLSGTWKKKTAPKAPSAKGVKQNPLPKAPKPKAKAATPAKSKAKKTTSKKRTIASVNRRSSTRPVRAAGRSLGGAQRGGR